MKNRIKNPFAALFGKGKTEKKEKSPKRRSRRQKSEKVYYSPAENMPRGTRIIGLVLRTLVLYAGVLGLVAFICGAAGLSTEVYWQGVCVSAPIIALLALLPSLAAALASTGRAAQIAVPLVYCAGLFGTAAIIGGSPVDFIVQSALRVYNYALYTVSSRGYYSLGDYMVPDGFDYANAGYAASDPQRFFGVLLLCSLVALVLYFCVQKKVRIIPLVLFMTAIIAPVLTYNIAKGNAGTGFTFAFIAGVIALKVYDYRYAGSVERRRKRKAARAARRAEAQKKRAAGKAEKQALRAEADKMFTAALEADMGMKRSRLARKAVYKARREAAKKAAQEKKNAAKTAKKDRKAALKNEKKAKKDIKKKIAALNRDGKSAEALSLRAKSAAESERRRNAAKSEKKSARDKKKEEKNAALEKSRRISYAGGFAGFGAVAAALLALWIPMAAVSGNFPVIDFINNRVQIVRAYATAYLSGNDVDLNDLQAYGIDELTPRQLSFEPLEYDPDSKILKVETTGESNVYLRSWIATDFDYESDSWSSADHDEVLAYRERFGKDFTPDEITTAFNKYVYPSTSEITDNKTYKNLSKFGFTLQQVNVWRIKGSGRILFVPSVINTDYSFMRYGKLGDSEYKYSRFYDGVYSSRFYGYGTGYSAISAVTAMNRAGVGESLENSIKYYKQCSDLIKSCGDSGKTGKDITAQLNTLEYSLGESGIDYLGTTIADRYFNSMSESEQKAYTESVSKEKDYAAYAADTYTQTTGSEKIKALAAEIAEGADTDGDGKTTRFESTMAVVNYLRNNYSYTLTPDAEAYTGEGSVLESFLFNVKEGYCTHFATAACELVREYGIPARYVEGYVATDFEKSTGAASAPYRSTVTEDKAHAWIEVYFDYVGWVQFEATAGDYADDMYNSDSATIVEQPEENQSGAEQEQENTAKPHDDSENSDTEGVPYEDLTEETMTDVELFVRVIIAVAAIVLAAFLVRLIVKRIMKKAETMMGERYRVIDRCKNAEAYADEKTDKHWLARQLDDWITDIYVMIGCEPQKGELPEEFCSRMRRDYGELSKIDIGEVIEAMQKEEFGHGLTYQEISSLAQYLEDIIASVYSSLSPLQKIRIRYIKRRI